MLQSLWMIASKAVFGLLKRARDYGDDDGDVGCSLSNSFLFQIFFHGLLQSEYRVYFHFLSYWSFYFSPLLSSAWDALIVRPQVSQSVSLVSWWVAADIQTYIFTVACGLLPVDMVYDDDGLVFSSHNKIQLVCMSMVMPHWVATSQLIQVFNDRLACMWEDHDRRDSSMDRRMAQWSVVADA